MRDIKFRGIHKGEWVYGSYVTDNKTYFAIVSENPHDECEMINQYVDVESVGQNTGLQDKNGVDIYEGDIVKWGHIEGYEEHTPRIAIVNMDISLSFNTVNLGEYNHEFNYGNFMYARSINKCMEVIGNKFESPELLEQ